MSNFYCQISCGQENFSIEEWNKAYKEINAMPISEAEKQKLIHPDPCEKQCFDCIAIVGARRKETDELLKNKKRKGQLMEKPEAIALFKEHCALPENQEKRTQAAKYQENRLIWDITGKKYGFRINNAGSQAKMFVFTMWSDGLDRHQSTIDLTQQEFNELVAVYTQDVLSLSQK